MLKDKKIIIVLIIALAVVLLQKLDFDLVAKNELGQVEGVSQEEGALKVVVLDVGQGDSIFIETPEKKQILIDGGEGQIILKRLDEQMKFNDRQIDIVVLTHSHSDHLSGLVEVLKRYEVSEVWMTGVIHTSSIYLEFLNLIKEKNIPTRIIFGCGREEAPGCIGKIEIENGVNVKILHPLENLSERRVDSLNNSSIVIRLDYKMNKFLLTGDAEVVSEKKILENFEIDELRADISKVGHHGSSDASSEKFLEATQLKYAIISVGKDNSYGHPSLRTIRRMERMEIEILRTDRVGNIGIISNGEDIEIY